MSIKKLLHRFGVLPLVCVFLCASLPAMGGLFDDEEARKAILDLRQKVDTNRLDVERKWAESNESQRRSQEENAQLRRSLLDLQGQIDALKADLAGVRGQNEQAVRDTANLARQLAEVQRQQKDANLAVEDRLRKFEPLKVAVDGREFVADQTEKRDFEAALAIFRKGDFAPAQSSFVDFLKRYPQSGYVPSALFWLGNGQYATRDYKEAVVNFKQLIAQAPDHARAPEAALAIANCQIELKDTRSARKSLEDLIKVYPQSEAAVAGKERLARLR